MTDLEKSPEDTEDSVPFYPDHVRTEAWVAFGVTLAVLVVAVLGLIFPVGLGDPADPMITPMHVKPEWYFLGLYQLLKFISKDLGAALPVVFVGLLVFWPFIDRKPDASPRAQRKRFIAVAVFTAVILALTLWGELS